MHYAKNKDAPKPKYIGLRVSDEMFDVVTKLSDSIGMSKTYIINRVLETWAKQEGHIK